MTNKFKPSKITLVIPAKKEKESLPAVLKELKKYQFKLIIVLEKNDIETIESIKQFKKKLIFQKRKGYGDALRLGIKNVKTPFFCIFNADGSFNPREINLFYKKLIKTRSDIVFGSRYEKRGGSKDDTIITWIGNKIFTAMGTVLFKLPITDILYTFVIGNTIKVNKLKLKSFDFRYCVELPIQANKNFLKIISCHSIERPRIAGVKKVNAFKDGFMILKEMIKQFF